MNSRSNFLKGLSEFLSILIAFIGLAILMGWAFNISILLHPGPGFTTIKSNTALAFLLIGISLWFIQTKRIKFHNQLIAKLLAFAVLFIVFLTLIEYIFNINLFIDQILFKEAYGALNTIAPNRMSLTSIINFILAGICVLLWNFKTRRIYKPFQILAIIGGFITLIGLLAYIYNVSLLYQIPQFTAMAIYTLFIFILLFTAILLARPDTGIMSIFNSNNIGGILARRLLTLTIVLPIILGLISQFGSNIGLYNEEFADIIFLFFIIIFMTLIVWITIISIKNIDDHRRLLDIEYQISLEDKVRDRTKELELSNKELELSNKDLKQFAYVASHDLKEPLRMISSFLQLLERRYKDKLDDDANDFIEYAVTGAQRLDYMINDLLEYSSVANKKREFNNVDVNKVLEQTVLNVKSSIDDNTAEITYTQLPTIWGDDQLLVLLFQNLISNSIKYRNEGIPIINITAAKESNQYLFTVKDNGIGMSPEHLKKIFTIFQRLHTREEYEGTGIGLAIAQKIVHQHAGEIWAESEIGNGTTFYFTIPIPNNEFIF